MSVLVMLSACAREDICVRVRLECVCKVGNLCARVRLSACVNVKMSVRAYPTK